MKAKEFFYLLGFRPKPKTFGFEIQAHDVAGVGRIEVARWLHPAAYRAVPSATAVQQLRRFLRPGDVAIDIGAHAGDTTIPIALAVGPTGLVLALEPNPYAFRVLERNAALNPDKVRILALNFAATRTDATYEFHYGDEGYCNGGLHEGVSKWHHGSAFNVQVQGRNLQDFLAREHPDLVDRLRFIKVDAEGFDLAILQTLDELLRRARPYLRVEMFSLRKSTAQYRRDLYAFLTALDYDLHRMESDNTLQGERITPENLLRWNDYDVFCVPRKVGTEGEQAEREPGRERR